jgi:hypothetical protein
MKEITLTQGQVALVDDEDFEWLSAYKWHCYRAKDTGNYYAARNENLRTADGKRTTRTVRMHRQILGLERGDPRKGDHIEPSQTLNNQRSNLRIANTDSESIANTRRRKDNTTGFKGVRQMGHGYQARIRIRGSERVLGTRDTPEEAHSLYIRAAQEAFGEFARAA